MHGSISYFQQEKTYNPYYTLVAQHLCKFSHSHKVTLQFCLWDFLRELGETGVGGAEMVKNLADDDDDFGGERSISTSRIRNIAKAYSWWIARGVLTVMILKVNHIFHRRPLCSWIHQSLISF
jgi:nucleolar MIF4G domain-containing protein 1